MEPTAVAGIATSDGSDTVVGGTVPLLAAPPSGRRAPFATRAAIAGNAIASATTGPSQRRRAGGMGPVGAVGAVGRWGGIVRSGPWCEPTGTGRFAPARPGDG